MISLKKLLYEILVRVKPNYQLYKFSSSSSHAVSTTAESTQSLTITTHGRPIYICYNGTFNPGASGAWTYHRIFRESTCLQQQVIVGPAANYNTPFGVTYLDNVPAGTYTYRCSTICGSGSGQLNENNQSTGVESPTFFIYEI